MKRKKLIIISLIIVCIVFIVIGIVLLLFSSKDRKQTNPIIQEKTPIVMYDLESVNNCIEEEKCDLETGNSGTIKINIEDKEVQEFVKKVNQQLKEWNEMAITSNLDGPECQSVKENYKNRYVIMNNIYTYDGEGDFSYSQVISKFDSCTKTTIESKIYVLIYDKGKQKVLSQEKFREKWNRKEENLEREFKEKYEEYDFDINNVYLYYNFSGNILKSYEASEQSQVLDF